MFIEKRRSKRKYLYLIIFFGLIFGGFYLYNSPMFEQNRPTIQMKDLIYWNFKKNLNVRIYDDAGIKNYRVVLDDGTNQVVLLNKTLDGTQRDIDVVIEPPKLGMFFSKKDMTLIVEATDSSKWDFFAGNKNRFEAKIIIDSDTPSLLIVNNSYSITKGGSAVVIFEAEDENLDELYINTNFGKRFYPQKFYKDNYYISLIAWPVNEPSFKATIVAKDKAGNSSKSKIRLYLKERRYRVSKIKLKDSFLDGKITELFEETKPNKSIRGKVEKFKYINETLRAENEKLIHRITSQVSFEEKITNFTLKAFYPLKNAAAVASFGDHRLFYYGDDLVSESYHVGLDLASVGLADIVSSNLARVAYADFNGIYGKMPILYHGLGLYSIYGHCSEISVSKGDVVHSKEKISKTGVSGLALGDHLHFGILVQGVEVRPAEWMDRKWIKVNIIDIINNSKKLINKR